jgi:hypothetical protein
LSERRASIAGVSSSADSAAGARGAARDDVLFEQSAGAIYISEDRNGTALRIAPQ